jgi:hypothetical protein
MHIWETFLDSYIEGIDEDFRHLYMSIRSGQLNNYCVECV